MAIEFYDVKLREKVQIPESEVKKRPTSVRARTARSTCATRSAPSTRAPSSRSSPARRTGTLWTHPSSSAHGNGSKDIASARAVPAALRSAGLLEVLLLASVPVSWEPGSSCAASPSSPTRSARRPFPGWCWRTASASPPRWGVRGGASPSPPHVRGLARRRGRARQPHRARAGRLPRRRRDPGERRLPLGVEHRARCSSAACFWSTAADIRLAVVAARGGPGCATVLLGRRWLARGLRPRSGRSDLRRALLELVLLGLIALASDRGADGVSARCW